MAYEAPAPTDPTPRRECAGERYAFLSSDREIYLQLAEDNAKLTLPQLVPRRGENRKRGRKLQKPWQSLGARGVNNLSAKLMLALFPPNEPFFQMMIGDKEIQELGGDTEKRTEIENGLAAQPLAVQRITETSSFRPSIFESLKHLVVSGNVMFQAKDDTSLRVYHLDSYVVKRDCEGNVLEIITQEVLHRYTIPHDVKAALMGSLEGKRKLEAGCNDEIHLYTWIRREDCKGMWAVHQEVEDVVVVGTEATYPTHLLPWVALRFIRVDGEDYGHGFVEEQYGDLLSFDILSRALVEGAVQGARVLWLVNPNGATAAKDVSDADNGAAIAGREGDVKCLQMDKYADFQVAAEKADRLERAISLSFMLNTAVQRDAERVTAEEIRAVINELEEGLGGIHSLLAQELQLPLATIFLHRLAKQGRIAKLPEGSAKPAVLTGLQAVGRTHDLNKLQRFIADLKMLGEVYPEVFIRVEVRELVERLVKAHGIDKVGLVPSEEEIQGKLQEKAQAEMAQAAGPKMIEQGTQAAIEAAKAQGGLSGP